MAVLFSSVKASARIESGLAFMENPIDLSVSFNGNCNGSCKRVSLGPFQYDIDKYQTYAPYGSPPSSPPEIDYTIHSGEGQMTLDLNAIFKALIMSDEDFPENSEISLPPVLASYFRRGEFSEEFTKQYKTEFRKELMARCHIPLEIPRYKIDAWDGDIVCLRRIYSEKENLSETERLLGRLLILGNPTKFTSDMEEYLRLRCHKVMDS
jgi:hypothetical protein